MLQGAKLKNPKQVIAIDLDEHRLENRPWTWAPI
jgi:threonine dehydrogenase-like Zn-dependent dehydrogenase